MRRIAASRNEDQISDKEIDQVLLGTIIVSIEIPLEPRDHGERVLCVGMTSERKVLVEIGIEDQDGELVVFHAREATPASRTAFEEEHRG